MRLHTIILLRTLVVSAASLSASVALAETLYASGLPHVNPLIGHWRLAEEKVAPSMPSGLCATELEFTEERYRSAYPNGAKYDNPVSNYNVQPGAVYIVQNRGASIYHRQGAAIMNNEGGMATCTYEKG